MQIWDWPETPPELPIELFNKLYNPHPPVIVEVGDVRQIAACVIKRKNHREYVAALRGSSGNIVITNTHSGNADRGGQGVYPSIDNGPQLQLMQGHMNALELRIHELTQRPAAALTDAHHPPKSAHTTPSRNPSSLFGAGTLGGSRDFSYRTPSNGSVSSFCASPPPQHGELTTPRTPMMSPLTAGVCVCVCVCVCVLSLIHI